MENILFFHDHAIIILTLITVITVYLVSTLIAGKKFNKFTMEGQEIETIWTIVPAFILIFIAIPSIKTLYLIEDSKEPIISIKVRGHQWYWSYQISSLNIPEIDLFIEKSLITRLVKTRECLLLPSQTIIRALITSQDVIHSWTVPSLGTKVDAIPGRINQIFLLSKRLGIFTGQCSEICGINHSFIPISIQFQSPRTFVQSIKKL